MERGEFSSEERFGNSFEATSSIGDELNERYKSVTEVTVTENEPQFREITERGDSFSKPIIDSVVSGLPEPKSGRKLQTITIGADKYDVLSLPSSGGQEGKSGVGSLTLRREIGGKVTEEDPFGDKTKESEVVDFSNFGHFRFARVGLYDQKVIEYGELLGFDRDKRDNSFAHHNPDFALGKLQEFSSTFQRGKFELGIEEKR